MIYLTLVRQRLDFFDPTDPFKTKPDLKNPVHICRFETMFKTKLNLTCPFFNYV